ncbi:hypothetical protein M0R45_004098 [Rubus argutus]|uniref:Pectinesterase inhibitor domain-containing protein n=1 Tax=Rubus argutus TaxID=59490 RepID=A0AAW1YIT6_RUBAR
MKNLMSLPAFIFLIQLVFHPICHCKVMFPMDANLIDQTCRKTPNYKLCVSSLKSDPRSKSADVRGLALVMVNVVKTKATTTLKRINELLKKTPRDDSLKDCHHMYLTILQADIVVANEAITLGDPKFAEESMNDAGIEATNCENNFKGRTPLTHLNRDVTNVSGVAAAIVRILL